MAKYVVVGQHGWTKMAFDKHCPRTSENDWFYYDTPQGFSTWLSSVVPKPDKLFFMHWSHIVPDDIVNNYECICFHPSHLPYGRGGTPIQNLIERGFTQTKLTAFRMTPVLDAGPIYLQHPLALTGTAYEIYHNIADISWYMIDTIIRYDIQPSPQVGPPTYFRRRKPDESEIKSSWELTKLYDHIRMLNAPDYPPAFLETHGYRISFFDPELSESSVLAQVEIEKIDG